MDQSKKTMRHFYCRDVLWETFEQMANDFDCSIDYLINESMRYYARSKNYQSVAGSPGSPHGGAGGVSNAQIAQPGGVGQVARPTSARTAAPSAVPPPEASRRPQTASIAPAGAPARPAFGASLAPGQVATTAPSQQPAPYTPPVAQAAGSTLYLVYEGKRYTVDKDQFIIGRGSKTSDLAIKDGNISRKHCAVIRRNGTFYIKDLGSTNGIDYKGMRIDNKRVDEGDIFHLCDYELRFTYRPE